MHAPRNLVRTVSRRMRRTLAAEPALRMSTISASTRARSACPVAMLFVTCLDLSLLCPARLLRSLKRAPFDGGTLLG
jgi:hypothetical protein